MNSETAWRAEFAADVSRAALAASVGIAINADPDYYQSLARNLENLAYALDAQIDRVMRLNTDSLPDTDSDQ